MTHSPPHPAHFRFSLRHLLGAVAVCAFGFVALAQANALWLSTVATLTAGAYFVTILGAVYWSGPLRAFAIGFTLWGVMYLGLIYFVLDSNAENGGAGHMLTSQMLARLHWRIWDSEPSISMEHYHWYMRIGQVWCSWLFGLLGGLLAQRFYVHGVRRSDPART